MLIDELKKLEDQMPKTFVQIVLNQYDTILALREKRYKLIAIYNALQKETIFPPNLTYTRFKDIWGIENRRRGKSKQTHDTKKEDVTTAPSTPPSTSIVAAPPVVTAPVPSVPSSPPASGGPRLLTDEEIKLRREERERERQERRALIDAEKEQEAKEKNKGVVIDPLTKKFTVYDD